MFPPTYHIENDLLPSSIKNSLLIDQEKSKDEIISSISILEKWKQVNAIPSDTSTNSKLFMSSDTSFTFFMSSDTSFTFFMDSSSTGKEVNFIFNSIPIDSKDIHSCTRAITSHISLKYSFDISLKSKCVNILICIFQFASLSVVLKSKILTSLELLFSYKHEVLQVDFPYQYFWKECIDVISREYKSLLNISSHTVLSNYFNLLCRVMYHGRRYIKLTVEELDTIVLIANQKLSNTSDSTCIEGLLFLVRCLPTNYPNYDLYLPQWFKLWKSIHNNILWDTCWLTIFGRARKYSSTFDWCEISKFIFVKIKELLDLTQVNGDSLTSFPYKFSKYYEAFFGTGVNFKEICINKLTKLMYFIVMIETRNNIIGVQGDHISMTPIDLDCNSKVLISGYNVNAKDVKPQCVAIMQFLQTLRIFFYPSNSSSWTSLLSHMISSLISEMTYHLGNVTAKMLFQPLISSNVMLIGYTTQDVFNTESLHIPSVHYLIGICMSILMEGVFSKSPIMINSACLCFKNILAIDSITYAPLVLSLFISALDPAAVNQSHQAPSALQGLIVTFKSLLFPNPQVLLSYLPQILYLSLPGLDASDKMKTHMTLNLFSTIFKWIPIIPNYDVFQISNISSYISFIESNGNTSTIVNINLIKDQFNHLGSIWEDWFPLFWNRIVILLDMIPNKQENVLKETQNTIPIVISDTICFIIRAMTNHKKLFNKFQVMFIDFIKHCSSYNAAKAIGRILKFYVLYSHDILDHLLLILLDQDFLLVKYSSEKLCFRLRCLGGSLRLATSSKILPHKETIQSLISNKLFSEHEDKDVRKNYFKFIKDLLRGLTSTYTIGTLPIRDVSHHIHVNDNNSNVNVEMKDKVIGSPTNFSNIGDVISWNEPTKEGIQFAIDILKLCIVSKLNYYKTLYQTYKQSNELPLEMTMKKLEESIVSSLVCMEKLCRGAAEILGDDLNSSNDENSDVFHILHSGRERVYTEITNDDDIMLLKTLRYQLLEFIYLSFTFFHEAIQLKSDWEVLCNSPMIWKGFMKLNRVLIHSRCSYLKDHVNILKSIDNITSINRSSFVTSIQSFLASHPLKEMNIKDVLKSHGNDMTCVFYWHAHDSSTSVLSSLGAIHYARRHSKYSIQSTKNLTRQSNSYSSKYLELYSNIFALTWQLCGHEYDVIRKHALKTINVLLTHFTSHHMKEMIKTIVTFTFTIKPTFAMFKSNLEILCNNRVLHRIISTTTLTDDFIQFIIHLPSHLSQHIDDIEKRSLVDVSSMQLFTKYLQQWSHEGDVSNQYSRYHQIQGILEHLQSTSTNMTLKHQSILSFLICHLVSPIPTIKTSNVIVFDSSNLWNWTLKTISNCHGQPHQIIALNLLVRLLVNLNHVNPNKLEEHVNVQSYLVNIWTFLSKDFFFGLSQLHVKASTEGQSSPQWSQGIDHILLASVNLGSILPRRLFDDLVEDVISNHFSFKITYALFLLFSNKFSHVNFNASILNMILNDYMDLKQLHQGQENDLAINILQAEVFAALYLVALKPHVASNPTTDPGEPHVASNPNTDAGKPHVASNPSTDAGANPSTNPNPNLGMEKILVDYFIQQTSNLSKDFTNEWIFALMFISQVIQTSDLFITKTSLLIEHIVSEFRQLTSHQSQMNVDENVGFTKHHKILAFVKVMLSYEVNHQQHDVHGFLLCDDVCNLLSHSIQSPFEVIRNDIAYLYGIITYYGALNSSNLVSTTCITFIEDKLHQLIKESQESQISKQVIEIALFWIKRNIQRMNYSNPILLNDKNPISFTKWQMNLMILVLEGCGHIDIDFAKKCHGNVLWLTRYLQRYNYHVNEDNIYKAYLQVMKQMIHHDSYHIRETILISLSLFISINWYFCDEEDKKNIKDMIIEMFFDIKPEVFLLAITAMTSYLQYKSFNEMKTLAISYEKNCIALATRELKKKKQDISISSCRSDKPYWTTLCMSIAIIRCFPYDLPSFLPSLLLALNKHVNYCIGSEKELIMKAIQDFKRSHQDNWNQFKKSFTSDELDDLQGSSVASYFS